MIQAKNVIGKIFEDSGLRIISTQLDTLHYIEAEAVTSDKSPAPNDLKLSLSMIDSSLKEGYYVDMLFIPPILNNPNSGKVYLKVSKLGGTKKRKYTGPVKYGDNSWLWGSIQTIKESNL